MRLVSSLCFRLLRCRIDEVWSVEFYLVREILQSGALHLTGCWYVLCSRWLWFGVDAPPPGHVPSLASQLHTQRHTKHLIFKCMQFFVLYVVRVWGKVTPPHGSHKLLTCSDLALLSEIVLLTYLNEVGGSRLFRVHTSRLVSHEEFGAASLRPMASHLVPNAEQCFVFVKQPGGAKHHVTVSTDQLLLHLMSELVSIKKFV